MADKGGSSSSWSKGSGRKKIPMKKIEKKTSLQVSLSKRRPGLFKKAKELSLLCGADVAVTSVSPVGKPFFFGNPSAEAIIDRHINSGGLVPRGQVLGRETLKRPEVVKEETAGGNRQGFWWEASDSEIERMGLTQLERFVGGLQELINVGRFHSAADSGPNSNQLGTSSMVESTNSEILLLQDLETMMEASPECNSFSLEDGFDWGFLFDESPSVEDSAAGCSFNQPTPIPVPAVTSWTPTVEYPASVATGI